MSGPQVYLGNPHQAALSQEQQQAAQPENDPMSDMGSDLMMDAILPGLGSVMSVSRELHGEEQRIDPLMDLMTGKPISHITSKPEITTKPVEPEPPAKPKSSGPTFDPFG